MQVAHFARPQAVDLGGGRQAHPQFLDFMHPSCLHETQFLPGRKHPVHDAYRTHYAAVLVVEGVEYQRLQRGVRVAFGRRDAGTNSVEQLGHAFAGLGRNAQRLGRRDPEHRFDLGRTALRVGGRQVDLVQDDHDLQVML
jgi:hypothetical protein